jgi:hypothetical protein
MDKKKTETSHLKDLNLDPEAVKKFTEGLKGFWKKAEDKKEDVSMPTHPKKKN